VKERPILFSASMVRAILAGRKTQTRRVVRYLPHAEQDSKVYPHECPYGEPGDRLWVRETFQNIPCLCCDEGIDVATCTCSDPCLYAADKPTHHRLGIWSPSIFMPHWASRINLEVVSVRVERLQEIGNDDAAAEGAFDVPEELKQQAARIVLAEPVGDPPIGKEVRARDYFRVLWDSTTGNKHPWSSNPFVWVIEFKRVRP